MAICENWNKPLDVKLQAMGKEHSETPQSTVFAMYLFKSTGCGVAEMLSG